MKLIVEVFFFNSDSIYIRNQLFAFRFAFMKVHIWGIERSGFFNGREKWAKGFENQMV